MRRRRRRSWPKKMKHAYKTAHIAFVYLFSHTTPPKNKKKNNNNTLSAPHPQAPRCRAAQKTNSQKYASAARRVHAIIINIMNDLASTRWGFLLVRGRDGIFGSMRMYIVQLCVCVCVQHACAELVFF